MRPTPIMVAARRLYLLGFAIHWLKPRSKMPLEEGWTTGPRKVLCVLRATNSKALNMGVRLGKPSKVGKGYLAAIDCDVKSEDPKHFKEMMAELHRLIGIKKLAEMPCVLSGRGNGSRHYYLRLSKPYAGKTITQSSELSKVRMVSETRPPSKRDLAGLTEDELKKGYRIRPAWEISLLGDGRQIVLPPSLHPDSGAEYTWKSEEPTDHESFPIYEPEFFGAERTKDKGDYRKKIFKVVEVDLMPLSEDIYNRIVTGEGSEDDSTSVFFACEAMYRAGYSRDEILSALTDRETYLGECAYRHAGNTPSRQRAGVWVDRYNLTPAIEKVDADLEFDSSVAVREVEEPEKDKELERDESWKGKLEKTKQGKTLQTLKNTKLVLTHCFPKFVKRNQFSIRDTFNIDLPWGDKKGQEVTDQSIACIRDWMAHKHRYEPNAQLVSEVVGIMANENGFHPVRDWLNGLEWDGVERLDTWMKDYLGAKGPEPYLSDVSRKILVAAVARVMNPGCKFDQILVLEGKQGTGKSSAAQILASPEYFLDHLPNLQDKDARLNLQGKWIVEWSELTAMQGQKELEPIKAFLSAQSDNVRPPYGHRSQEYRRQCIFIGTTNARDYLKDRTGNRRFWPVEIKRCAFKKLKAIRDQLFAEALVVYENFDEPLYLEDEAKRQAEKIQSERVAEDLSDHYEEIFLSDAPECVEFRKLKRFKMAALFTVGGPFQNESAETKQTRAAGHMLTRLGYERKNGRNGRYWRAKMGPEISGSKGRP